MADQQPVKDYIVSKRDVDFDIPRPNGDRYWVAGRTARIWVVRDIHNSGWHSRYPTQESATSGCSALNKAHAEDMARKNSSSGLKEAPELKQFGPYDKELGIFMSVMRHKLERNAHRGRWQDADVSKVLDAIDAEVRELRDAVASGDPAEVMLEAADVANFALIVAFVALRGKK